MNLSNGQQTVVRWPFRPCGKWRIRHPLLCLVERAQAMGGTCTDEHRIGQGPGKIVPVG
jgi:hypothetical protein